MGAEVAEFCNFIKINTPPCAFFTFLKLYKCYKIAQRTTNVKQFLGYSNICGYSDGQVNYLLQIFKLYIEQTEAATEGAPQKKVFLKSFAKFA